MSDIGHNSAAYGEQIFTESFVLGDDHKKLFHYVQWQLADYITGTQGMTVDQEGVYMRFLVRLYDRGQAFPDDDRMMARVMGMDMRPWRRIKLQLIDMGKILIKNGSLTNSRFERERQKRAAELRKQAEKTREYWEKKRAEKDTSDELPANFRETSGELPSEVSRKVPKKSNEINENDKHPIRHTRESRVQSLKEERKKDNPPQNPESDAASECGGGDHSGLNGSAALIVQKLAAWINPIMPDKRTAQGALDSLIRLYTAPVVRDSFAELEAKILHGDIIARPIPYLTSACQRRAAAPPGKAPPVDQRLKGIPEKFRREIEAKRGPT